MTFSQGNTLQSCARELTESIVHGLHKTYTYGCRIGTPLFYPDHAQVAVAPLDDVTAAAADVVADAADVVADAADFDP